MGDTGRVGVGAGVADAVFIFSGFFCFYALSTVVDSRKRLKVKPALLVWVARGG